MRPPFKPSTLLESDGAFHSRLTAPFDSRSAESDKLAESRCRCEVATHPMAASLSTSMRVGSFTNWGEKTVSVVLETVFFATGWPADRRKLRT